MIASLPIAPFRDFVSPTQACACSSETACMHQPKLIEGEVSSV